MYAESWSYQRKPNGGPKTWRPFETRDGSLGDVASKVSTTTSPQPLAAHLKKPQLFRASVAITSDGTMQLSNIGMRNDVTLHLGIDRVRFEPSCLYVTVATSCTPETTTSLSSRQMKGCPFSRSCDRDLNLVGSAAAKFAPHAEGNCPPAAPWKVGGLATKMRALQGAKHS